MTCRRESPRAPVRLDVAYEERGRPIFCSTLNLSELGAFLRTGERPKIGERVHLVLSLPPEGVFLRLRGTVVRYEGQWEPKGFAIRFDASDPQQSSTLAQFVAASDGF
jgi:hypothetical protein